MMDFHPNDYMKMYLYIFYMTCPDPDLNPYFDVPEDDKEDLILHDIDADFSTDDDYVQTALERCKTLYQTPTYRAYEGIKKFMDKMAVSMANENITFGRDGSSAALLRMAEKFDDVRQSFKGVYKDLVDEQKSTVRGGQNLAYDQ